MDPPRLSHPVTPTRPIASLAGRAEPDLYAAGWLLSVGALFALVALLAAALAGLTNGAAAVVVVALIEVSLLGLAAGFSSAAMAQSSQRRNDGWQDYFGPSPVLVLAAWLAISSAGVLLLDAAMDALSFSPPSSVATLLLLSVNVASYIGTVQLLVVRPGALSWSDMARPRHLAPDPTDWFEPSAWAAQTPQSSVRKRDRLATDIALGLGLAIPLMVGTLLLAAALTTLLGMDRVTYEGPIPASSTTDVLVSLLAAAILAPIGEEIFFRGFATNAWARSLTRNSAILRAAVFFAGIHVINVDIGGHSDPSILLRAAFLAVVVRLPVAWGLAWVFTRRRSIYASAFLHATYNAGLTLLAWWAINYTPGQ
jgi:membrane protease YdiL (CAAX protease family)